MTPLHDAVRVRRLTPTEWLYLCMEPGLPPFTIQLLIGLDHLPGQGAIANALAACVEVNPAARLQARGRWWWDEGRPPAIVTVEPDTPFSLHHPALQRRLDMHTAPALEVLCWPGTGLVLRCAHALMDAAGLLHFAQDFFRALRGEPLLGSLAAIDDWTLLTTSPHRRPLRTLRPAWPSPAGAASGEGAEGFVHEMRRVPGRVDSPTARVAAALAQAAGGCRLMIPVDLRLSQPGLRTTANLSNPLIMDFEAGWDWNRCWREVLGGLRRHEEFGVSRASAVLPWLPARLTSSMLSAAHSWQARRGRHLFSALSSNLARTSRAAFAFAGQLPNRLSFLPFDTPGAGLNLLTLQHEEALEVAASCPAESGSGRRLSALLDCVCAELARGVPASSSPTPAPRHQPVIAIAASFVAEPLASHLSAWMQRFGLTLAPRFAPYGQVLETLADPGSIFATNHGGVNLVLLRLEDAFRHAHSAEVLHTHADELIAALGRAAGRGDAPLIVWLSSLSRPSLQDAARRAQLEPLQARVTAALRELHGLALLDDEQVLRWVPVDLQEALLGDAVGHMPFSRERYAGLASALARQVVEAVLPPFKVIVVDADNTLWRGACAELGPIGVQVTAGHRALQAWLVGQVDAGRLVCLCSRNEPDDVQAVFDQHPAMLLRPEHVVARRINWARKSDNLKSLAAELRLGLESFVFIDDNPVEGAEVQAHCAGVQVLRVPLDTDEMPHWLEHLWALAPVMTPRTLPRTELYRQDGEREALRADSTDFQAFLDSLQLQVRLSPPQADEWERVAELSRRTNQFNLAPQPRSAAQFRALMPDMQCLAVHVEDRFGAYGLTGVLTWRLEAGALCVDTWMLSCRVLGRGVEHRVLVELGAIATRAGCEQIVLMHLPTARNGPARAFLDAHCECLHAPVSGQGLSFRISAELACQARPSAAVPAPQAGAVQATVAALPAGVLDEVARTRSRLPSSHAAKGALPTPPLGERTMLSTLLALANSVAERQLGTISPDESLVDVGMDSLQIVTLLDEAARWHGVTSGDAAFDQRMKVFMDRPTLRALAHAMTGLSESSAA